LSRQNEKKRRCFSLPELNVEFVVIDTFHKEECFMRNKFMFAILLCSLLIAVFTFSSVATPRAFAATTHAVSAASPFVACPPTISEGSTGNTVKTLQRDLNAHIIGVTPLKVDGIFGSQTKNRVESWQDLNGLAVDGIVGPKTWHSLGAC
jgi:putative peptidoglycan binding protein